MERTKHPKILCKSFFFFLQTKRQKSAFKRNTECTTTKTLNRNKLHRVPIKQKSSSSTSTTYDTLLSTGFPLTQVCTGTFLTHPWLIVALKTRVRTCCERQSIKARTTEQILFMLGEDIWSKRRTSFLRVGRQLYRNFQLSCQNKCWQSMFLHNHKLCVSLCCNFN